MPGGRVHDGRQPVGDDRFGGVGDGLRQHEHRHVDAGVAQLHAFLDERDRERAAPASSAARPTSTAPCP